MFHSTNIFYLDIFAVLLTKLIHKMKKIMRIFGIVVFAFTLTLTSCTCGGCEDDCTKECCAKTEGLCPNTGEKCLDNHSCCKASCADDCTKDCCAKKSCADDCTKDCCAKAVCADDCTKECCAD